MSEINVEDTESRIENTNWKAEGVEAKIEKLDEEIAGLEQKLAGLKNEEKQVIDNLEAAIQEKRQERETHMQEVRQILGELENERQNVIKIDKWNEELVRQLPEMERLAGHRLDAAENRVAERRNWVEREDARIAEVQKRLSRFT